MAIARPVTRTQISTTGWGIPITDEVNALRTELNALKAVVPWINLTLISGWAVAGGMTPQYRKVGDMVQVRGSVGIAAGGPGTNIAILPAGYRPPIDIQVGTIGFTTFWQLAQYDVVASNGALRFNSSNPVACAYVPISSQFSVTP